MLKQLELVRKKENRTRSELMREALRQYIETRYPLYSPTKAELIAIRKGRAESPNLSDMEKRIVFPQMFCVELQPSSQIISIIWIYWKIERASQQPDCLLLFEQLNLFHNHCDALSTTNTSSG